MVGTGVSRAVWGRAQVNVQANALSLKEHLGEIKAQLIPMTIPLSNHLEPTLQFV